MDNTQPPQTLQVPFNPDLAAPRQQWEVRPLRFSDFEGKGALQQKVQVVLSNHAQTQGRFLSSRQVSIPQRPPYPPPIATTQLFSAETQSSHPYPLRGNCAHTQDRLLPSGAYEVSYHEESAYSLPVTALAQIYDAERDLRTARVMVGNGDYHGALVLINQALSYEPNNAKAHSYRALCLQYIGDFSGAIVSANGALAIYPRNMLALITKVECLFYFRQIADSLKDVPAIAQCLQTICTELENPLHFCAELGYPLPSHIVGRLDYIASSLTDDLKRLKTH